MISVTFFGPCLFLLLCLCAPTGWAPTSQSTRESQSALAYSDRDDRMVAASTQTQEIRILCPQRIQIGPVNLGKEWESQLNTWIDFKYAQVSSDDHTKTQLAGCWYGDANRLTAISRKVPAGYACAVTGISVTCKLKARVRTDH